MVMHGLHVLEHHQASRSVQIPKAPKHVVCQQVSLV